MTSEHAGPRALRKLVEAVLSISADLDLQAVLEASTLREVSAAASQLAELI